MSAQQAESRDPVLEVRGLTVRLPANAERANAVEDVSLTVGRGEIVCVVGESGSGKSVTAHAVMGLLPKKQLVPTAGEILLGGEDLLKVDEARLRELRGSRMSMIFQEPMTALNPVLTVGRQVAEMFRLHTDLLPGERQKRVLELFTAVKLPDPERLVHAYPHQLSGGQRQRIMIAMALALRPSILIADEPTTALDVTTQASILALIRDIQLEHGISLLFITHDFGVVADIAHRVVVMQKGRVVETGPTERILSAPEQPYTQSLIAAVPGLVPKRRGPPLATPTVLAVDGLSMTYRSAGFFQKAREVHAAKNVSLRLHRGETLGIVGESGSGKSTVARCIVRLIRPSGGTIDLNGQEVARASGRALRPYRKRVQVIFQDPYRSLNPRRTVMSSLIEGPMNYGTSSAIAHHRAGELLRLVGLGPEAGRRYPHQFSGGQRQRICIARALAMEPELLVADEAVSALDVSIQAQVLDLIERIRREFNLSILFITHDLRVAAQICDTVAVMYRGEIVETGPTAQVFEAPRHSYTQALLRSAPGQNWIFGSGAARPRTANATTI